MPATPYPVSGVVYDSDGTTTLASSRVDLRNATQNTSISTTTNSNGEYLIDLANLTSGYSDGDSISVFASYGRYFDEEIFTVVVSTGFKSQDLTLETLLPTAVQYCSVDDVRNYTKVQVAEYTDKAVSDMINRASDWIDESTGRTWKGITTVTDKYYNGTGNIILELDHIDIVKITALAIDTTGAGTYTDLTVSDPWVPTDDYFLYGKQGFLTLNPNASISNFTSGAKRVKISYTYGHAYASETVRRLCMLMVANEIHLENVREKIITKILDKLTWKLRVVPS